VIHSTVLSTVICFTDIGIQLLGGVGTACMAIITSIAGSRPALGAIFIATGFESQKSPQYSTKLCLRKKGVLGTMDHQKVRNIPLNYAIIFVEYFGQLITKKSAIFH